MQILLGMCVAAGCWATALLPSPAQERTPSSGIALTFERNTGRYDERVKFVTRTSGATIFLAATEAVMVVGQGKQQDVGRSRTPGHREAGAPSLHGGHRAPLSDARAVRMRLVGARSNALAKGEGRQAGSVNYLSTSDPRASWTHIPMYSRARFEGVYDGIDLAYYGSASTPVHVDPARAATSFPSKPCRASDAAALEYDLIVHPGADPQQIVLAFDGAEGVWVAGGDIVLATEGGEIRVRRPYAYQEVHGRRIRVACEYALRSEQATLKLARHDASLPLVIDPVLEYSTFIGGGLDDYGRCVAVDAARNVYIAGTTHSTDYPVTPGAYSTTRAGSYDVVITKLDPTGSNLMYSSYIGGPYDDQAFAMAVDASGSAYVTGFSDTPSGLTEWQGTLHKVSPSGDAVTTRSVGPNCVGLSVAVDAASNAYVAGNCDDGSGFVRKLTPSGWSGYSFSFERTTHMGSIAVDSEGCAYVSGRTLNQSFEATPGAVNLPPSPNQWRTFVVKLNPSGTLPIYAVVLPSGDAPLVAVDPSRVAHIVTRGFPYLTPGAYVSPSPAKLLRLSRQGDFILSCCSAPGEVVTGLAVDELGAAVLSGSGLSEATPDATDTTPNGGLDAYVARLDPSGRALDYATYVGGSGDDRATGVALDDLGAAHVVGYTNSSDFPVTEFAPGPSRAGGFDVFAAKIGLRSRNSLLRTLDRTANISDATIMRAYLKSRLDGWWLDGRAIEFTVDGTWVGTAVTGATGTPGRADLDWVVGEGPARRLICALFRGDEQHDAAEARAVFTATTVTTKMVAFSRTVRMADRTELKCRLVRSDNVPLYGRQISFYVDGTFVIARPTDVEGYARYPYYDVPDSDGAGQRSVVAEWKGNGGYAPVSQTATLTVLPALPHVWVLSKSAPFGDRVSLYAYVRRLYDYRRMEAKIVVFHVDGSEVGTAATGTVASGEPGIARLLYQTTEAPGSYAIRCDLLGDAELESGSGTATLRIY